MSLLAKPAHFFDALRHGLLGPTLSQGEVDGLNALLTALAGWPLAWAAYGFATAYHETAHTLQPVKELGSEAYFTRMYDPPPTGNRPSVALKLGNTEPGDGAKFCGRGYAQCTGRANYVRAGRILGLGDALVQNPDLALEPLNAAKILRSGLEVGWFSDRALRDFLPADGPATRAQFIAARWTVNRQDKADLIADYAVDFQSALADSGWA